MARKQTRRPSTSLHLHGGQSGTPPEQHQDCANRALSSPEREPQLEVATTERGSIDSPSRQIMSDDIPQDDEPLFSLQAFDQRMEDLIEFAATQYISSEVRDACLKELEEAKKDHYRIHKTVVGTPQQP